MCGVQARHLGAAFPPAIPPPAREPRVILRQYYAVFMLSDRSRGVRGGEGRRRSNLLSRPSEWWKKKRRIRRNREEGRKEVTHVQQAFSAQAASHALR